MKTRARTRLTWLPISMGALGVFTLIGCGAERTGSITEPSSSVVSPPAAPITGTLGTMSDGASPGVVRGDITVTAVVSTTACPSLQFSVSSYVFKTSPATQYSGGACADISAGRKLSITGTRASQSELSIDVTQIVFRTDSPPPVGPTTTIRAEGVVASIISPSACPSLYFTITGGYTFNTSAATAYPHGSCTSIKVGSKISLIGAKQSDGVVLVSQLTVDEATSPTPTKPSDTVSGEGIVGSLATGTACPALDFLIGPYTIKTTASTQYEGGSCGDIKVGVSLAIAGAKQTDSSVSASYVRIKSAKTLPQPPSTEPVSGEGVVTGLATGTGCPALDFLIGPYTIRTSAETQYEGGACSDIKAGVSVRITGVKETNGRVSASRVAIKSASKPAEPAEGEGVVTGLATGTSCPSLTFLIGEYRIGVDESTQYYGGACSDIKGGAKVGVKGVISERKVSASRISFKK